MRVRFLIRVPAAAAFALTVVHAAAAQEIGRSRHAWLPAPHNGAFQEAFPEAAGLFNATDYQQAVLYEALWTRSSGSQSLESAAVTLVSQVIDDAPAHGIEARAVAPMFFRTNPDIDALLDWGRIFRRQVRDVLAAGASSRTRDGRMQELVASYRAREELAVSALPRSPDVMDAQPYSLEYRGRYPRYTSLGWAARWLELALLEALVAGGPDPARSVEAVMALHREMLYGSPSCPRVLPLMPAVATSFARAYPEAAAIIDNLNMLEESVADILVDREIPRSAKRQEILRMAARYRDDTTSVVTLETWFRDVTRIGVENMGGAPLPASSTPPVPTLLWGSSMAGMVSDPAAPYVAGHETGTAQPTVEALLAVQQRMMADPVIRERVATDPVLVRMLAALETGTEAMPEMDHGAMDDAAMPGMDHGAMDDAPMPGMDHGAMERGEGAAMTPAAASDLLSGTPAERERAIEFVVRLLSDPAVESRIHADPELHALWTDPEVQRRLAELRRSAAP